MNRILSVLAVLLIGFSAEFALASSWNQTDIQSFNDGEPNGAHTRDHGFKVGSGKCVFDTATTANRTIAPHTCDLKIPKNSYVTKVFYKVITTFTSATDAATIAISITAANDLVSAAAISTGTTWDAAGPVVGIATGAMTNEVAVTADSYPTFTVAIEALTAGKMVVYFEWVYYGDVL